MKKQLKFIDLFAGLGGFHIALSKLGCKCVFACEIKEDLRDLYEENFHIKPAGDITKVDYKKIPQHDILCAGFLVNLLVKLDIDRASTMRKDEEICFTEFAIS